MERRILQSKSAVHPSIWDDIFRPWPDLAMAHNSDCGRITIFCSRINQTSARHQQRLLLNPHPRDSWAHDRRPSRPVRVRKSRGCYSLTGNDSEYNQNLQFARSAALQAPSRGCGASGDRVGPIREELQFTRLKSCRTKLR